MRWPAVFVRLPGNVKQILETVELSEHSIPDVALSPRHSARAGP